MYTNFAIKNFRIFDKEGAVIPLRPITILTGCNNVGKSSVVKALCLLKDFCQQIESDFEIGKDIHIDRYKMDFHKAPNNLLGGFDLVKHHNKKADIGEKSIIVEEEPEDSTKNNHVVFEIIVESSWLLQDVLLQLEFDTLDTDDLNNGYLHAYTIKTLDDKVIYRYERSGGDSPNFSIVKKSFLYFIYGQYAFANWQNVIYMREAYDEFPSEDEEDLVGNLFDESFRAIRDDLGVAAVFLFLEWQVSHCFRGRRIGPASPLIEKIPEDSFVINSPKLGVFCFFPCLQIYKDFEKKDIRQEINKRLDLREKPISSAERGIIDLFMDTFEASDSDSLHEFISQKENERFFDISEISRTMARVNETMSSSALPYAIVCANSPLPETANWDIILYAMDLINMATMNTTDSLLDFWRDYREYHKMEGYIDKFLNKIINDVLVNIFPGAMMYSPTSIVQPQRLYLLEDNNDFARTLKIFFETKKIFNEVKDRLVVGQTLEEQNKTKNYKPCMFINQWLKQLEIADHVEIKTHADGYGVSIHLFENENDSTGMHLIDKGYGVLQLFAVLLKIEIAILKTKTIEKLHVYDTKGLNEDLVPYLRTYKQLHPITIALEEPECHLHPSLQSKFADMLIEAYKQHGVHFLIESHSEYLIRRLQLLVSKGEQEIRSDEISLLYVNPSNRPAYLPIITDIGIDRDGTLKNEFGTGFFDESSRLSKELIKNKTEEDDNEDKKQA